MISRFKAGLLDTYISTIIFAFIANLNPFLTICSYDISTIILAVLIVPHFEKTTVKHRNAMH